MAMRVNRARTAAGIMLAGVLATAGITLLHAEQTAPPELVKRHIYSATANPRADIKAAIIKAHAEHKRIILDFGGDWCGDCQMLDIYFRQSPNADLLKHFVVVHIDVGETGIETNFDIGEKYGIPLHKGVPALAVLDSDGRLLYSQKNGEFESMRTMDAASVTQFLTKWKG